jgi:hypothetical protein
MRNTFLTMTAAAIMALVVLAPDFATAQNRSTLDIYVADVEGGNATLFVSPSGQSVLIDTGWVGPKAAIRDAERIMAAASDAHLTQICHLITTHGHANPTPHGFSAVQPEPEAAYFDNDLGEFLLPYDAVRRSNDPEATLMSFLDSTYRAAGCQGSFVPGISSRAAAGRRCHLTMAGAYEEFLTGIRVPGNPSRRDQPREKLIRRVRMVFEHKGSRHLR